jgi:hypothetical protein
VEDSNPKTKITITNEHWLKKSPQEQGVYNIFVNQRILPNWKVWDCHKIKLLFPLNVANSIFSWKLGIRRKTD